MKSYAGFGRRAFLYGSAAAAGAIALAACSGEQKKGVPVDPGAGERGPARGSATQPLPVPTDLSEAPSLTEQVESGSLPPLSERLPAVPYVVPHNWLEPGNYGGNLLMITSSSESGANAQYSYGYSFLRYLNDGLDVGPGLVESWDSNDDASEWTLHFREGLKWSDGQPWTTADIMFWWEDIVLNEEHTEGPPDDARSGTGTIMEMTAPDDLTIVMRFDAPAPLTIDRLATWVNGAGRAGPTWMLPRHYLEQFHPTYNSEAPTDWAAAGGAMDLHANFARNPECPTMTGWRLRDYNEGESLVWERNPYYWCVGPDGAQLPYLDTITMRVVQDPEVGKLQVHEGEVDYLHGPHFATTLADVSSLMQSRERSDTDVFLWDGGSGSGAVVFPNHDYTDELLRDLFREPKFRQALSHAINREEIRKAVYFDSGQPSTGTLSPKAIEYKIDDQGHQVYENWRTSYVAYDIDRANALLDELGLTDSNGDGWRELPDGSDLALRLDVPADARNDYVSANNQIEQNWRDVGLNTTQNPVSPTAYSDQWSAGQLMIRTAWAVSDGPNHLVYPQWLVPIEPSRWAPLTGQFYNVRGTQAEHEQLDVDPFDRTPPRMEPEPGGPVERLWELYDQSRVEPDEMERHRLVWEMIKIHIEHGPFFIGTVADTPHVVVVRNGLGNVPKAENLAQGGFVEPFIHPTPAVYDPECYFWHNPSEHD